MCLFLLILISLLILDLNHLIYLSRTCYYKLLLPVLTYLYILHTYHLVLPDQTSRTPSPPQATAIVS